MAHVDPVIDKIIVARVGLLLRHPFFGNLATRLQIKEGWDGLTTAATDGRNIFFNREFFEKMSVKQVEFVIAHEIMHNVFDHMGRCEGRDRKIYNIAADYCVNGQLVRDRIGDHNVPDIKIFHNPKHYGKSAEQVYDEIFDDMDEKELEALGQLLDEHIDWGNSDGKKDGQPRYSKEELKQIRDEMREATMQAAQAAGAGNIPASVARMIKELTEPKMNWREILRQQIQSTIKNDYSFMRMNRKGWHMSAILPGTQYDETIDICVAIDMSGSIGDEQAKDFLTEIKGIMQEYKDFKIKVWCFDTKVYNEMDYDGYSMDEFDQYEPMGGGGTEFDANWEYMKENQIQPKKFIMFTDGYPWGSWGDKNYCDTVFIIHGNNTIVPPFGEVGYYEELKATA
ncbi:vWFA domain containing protein [uncultured Caudovirales phage]|uniref:VWFA domain containing protein n=1 Tax=uncultured Caudovirales phage TaxID=2100421 RepID=A0A6J7WL97_9CAUD|nr:vWFA domain containing protein [uncultured Caudovirales phage]CAB5209090.1 vWFA domain containing protein [uncultured Caudovirales phage]